MLQNTREECFKGCQSLRGNKNVTKRTESARLNNLIHIFENTMSVQKTNFKHFRKSVGLILLKFANGFVQTFTALNVSGSGMTKQHSIANYSMGL